MAVDAEGGPGTPRRLPDHLEQVLDRRERPIGLGIPDGRFFSGEDIAEVVRAGAGVVLRVKLGDDQQEPVVDRGLLPDTEIRVPGPAVAVHDEDDRSRGGVPGGQVVAHQDRPVLAEDELMGARLKRESARIGGCFDLRARGWRIGRGNRAAPAVRTGRSHHGEESQEARRAVRPE